MGFDLRTPKSVTTNSISDLITRCKQKAVDTSKKYRRPGEVFGMGLAAILQIQQPAFGVSIAILLGLSQCDNL